MNVDVYNEKYYYEFYPGCSYQTGEYKWYSYVSGDECYANARSDNYTIKIYGNLYTSIISPSEYQYVTEGQNVVLRASVIDDCSVTITDANVYFILRNERTGDEFRCPENGFANYDGTSYVCSFNTIGKPGGNYSVIAYSSKNYYWNSSVIKENAFFLITPVRILNVTMAYEQDGGWGEIHNFTAFIDHYNDVIVCLLEKPIDSQQYQISECKNLENPSGGKYITFSKRYTCSDFVRSQFWNYKINATEFGVPSSYSESQEYSHLLQKNDLQLTIVYNDTEAKRYGEEKAILAVYAYDLDQKQPAYVPLYSSPNIKYQVYNGTSFVYISSNSTNSSGYSIISFKPDCSYMVGPKEWYSYTEADACYKNVISNRENITIVGRLNPLLVFPIEQQYNRYAQLYVNLSAIVRDECNSVYFDNANVIFKARSVAFGTEYLCENVVYDNGYYNCSLNATEIEEGWYDVNVTASGIVYYDSYYYIQPNSFKIIHTLVPPVLRGEEAIPEQDGGWGERWYFRVNVSDLNGDDVNIYLWISRDGNNWELVNSTVCYNCGSERTIELSYKGFTCEDRIRSPIYFKFNASDVYNTTDRSPNMLYLNKNDAVLEYYSGNESYIIREIGDFLRVRVYDADAKYYSNANVSLFVTTDGNNFVYIDSNISEDSIVSLFFNPDCRFYRGLQYWKAEIIEDECYKPVSSETFTTYIVGHLQSFITYPSGQKFLRGSNITLNISVKDECNVRVEGATLNITMISNLNPNYKYNCTEIIDLGDGNYSCTFNSTDMLPRFYNVSYSISRTYYISNNFSYSNIFWIETNPILFNLRATPNILGWGETLTVKVNFTDEDLDTLYVNFYLIKGNSYKFSSVAVSGINVEATTTFTFSPGDIGDWTVIANVSDDFGKYELNTSITVEKDDVSIILVSGNNSVANRAGQYATFTLLAWDTDRNTNVMAGLQTAFWVTNKTNDLGSYKQIGTSYTSSDGTFSINFAPDCSFEVGVQRWKGGLLTNQLYKEANSTDYFVNVVSEFDGTITQPSGNILLRGTDNLLIRGYLTDRAGCGLVKGATVLFGIEGTDINCLATDEGNGYYSCIIDSSTLSLLPYGWYNVTMNASREFYVNNVSVVKENAFYLADNPKLSNPQVSPGYASWGTKFVLNVTLYDFDYDTKTVYLWLSKDGTNWFLGGTQIYVGPTPYEGVNIGFEIPTSCANISLYYFKFNATDTSGYSTEIPGSTFTVDKRPTAVIPVYGNNARVNREYQIIPLTVKVLDALNGSEVSNVNVGFFLYNKYGSEIFYENRTNSSGIVYFEFDPDCTFNPGSTSWIAGVYNDACYVSVNSTYSILVAGQLKTEIIEPYKDSKFPTGELIKLNISVYSDCLEEGRIDNADLNVKIVDPYDTIYECSPITQFNGFYNCTFNSSFKKPGYYDVLVNSTKEYYDYNYTEYIDWFEILNAPPTYSNIQVNPTQSYWTDRYVFSVDISDSDFDKVNCSLEIKEKIGDIWNYINSTIIEGSGTCSFTIDSFSCDDIGEREFRFVLDDGANEPVITEIGRFNLTKSLINITLVSGNGTSIIRQTGYGTFSVRVYDLIKNKNIGYSNNLPETNVIFKVTKDGNNYIILTPDGIGTYNGLASTVLVPDCSYLASLQKWQAYVENDACYYDNSSEEFYYNVIGKLEPRVISPTNGIKYLKGSNVSIYTNVSDDCGNLVDADTFNITLRSVSTSTNYVCEHERIDIGNYNCTFETSDKPAGYYSIILNATKLYHLSSTYTENNAFWIETLPSVINLGTNRPLDRGGWGEPWSFRANVTDEDKDPVYVYAWYRVKGTEEWQLLGTGQKSQGTISSIVSITPSPSFDCSKLLGLPEVEYEFFFNVSDDDSNTAESNIRNFTLEKDDITVSIVQGDGIIYNRSSPLKVSLGVSVFDRDRNSAVNQPYNASLYVTYNGYSYVFDQIRTSSSGTITFSFPNASKCLYQVGPQLWRVNIDSLCYKSAASPIGSINITTIPLNVTLTYPVNKVFDLGQDVPVIININDDCGFVPQASVDLVIKNQDGQEYVCNNLIDYLNGTYSCTFSNLALGYYTVLVNASKQNYPEGETYVAENAFLVASYPSISNVRAYSSRRNDIYGGWGDLWIFEVQLYDSDQEKFDFERLNISLYVNLTGNYELVNSTVCYSPECKDLTTITLTTTFDCNAIGNRNYKIVLRDYFNNTAEDVGFINIQPNEVSLYVREYPASIVREGENSGRFIVSVYDEDRRIYASDVNTTFKFTKDGSNFNFVVYGLSDSYGNVSYDLNPDCSFNAGYQYFKAETSDYCYSFSETLNYEFDIIGSLRNYIIDPKNGSEIIIEYGKSINISTLIEDECENEVGGALVELKAIWPNNYQENIPFVNSLNGIYNFSWDLSYKIGGSYSFLLSSSKEHYNS
ncbi:MAG: hypothetical protein QXR84_08455, partial [Candidatus Bathyarchaeia archaeon]